MKLHRSINRLTAGLLAAALILTSCSGGSEAEPSAKATTMYLKRTQGDVAVLDDGGKDVALLENLGLYSGYGVDTLLESYAWINLDDVKLTKMDQESQIAITKKDKNLEIEVKSGSLFFNVTEPLENDETMNIRTSSMIVGIRGTCGWVEVSEENRMNLYLLEGTVECTAGENTAAVTAGEMAAMTDDGDITVSEFTVSDIASFVLEEIEDNDELTSAVAVLDDSGTDEQNPSEEETAADETETDDLEQYRAIVTQADSYDYGGGEPNGVYRYALVQMQPDNPVPALLLEQETTFGIANIIIFQYDPDNETVSQTEGVLSEGVASAGGYRGSLSAAGDGNGLLSTEFSSGTGEGSTQRITVEGNSLAAVTLWEGNIFDETDQTLEEIGSEEIPWNDIGDLEALDSWTLQEAQPAMQETEEVLPTDGDRIVLTGTIDTYTFQEVIAMQNIPADQAQWLGSESDVYRFIVLDTPQVIALGRSSEPDGSLYSDEVEIIDVSWAEGLEQYDGQHLTFSIDPTSTIWPSDASLPLGQPRTTDIHVLDAGE